MPYFLVALPSQNGIQVVPPSEETSYLEVKDVGEIVFIVKREWIVIPP